MSVKGQSRNPSTKTNWITSDVMLYTNAVVLTNRDLSLSQMCILSILWKICVSNLHVTDFQWIPSDICKLGKNNKQKGKHVSNIYNLVQVML